MEKYKEIMLRLRMLVVSESSYNIDIWYYLKFLNEQVNKLGQENGFTKWLIENNEIYKKECKLNVQFKKDESIIALKEVDEKTQDQFPSNITIDEIIDIMLNGKMETKQTPTIFIDTIDTFIAKETFSLETAIEWFNILDAIKKKRIFELEEDGRIINIINELELMPDGLKSDFLRKQYQIYFDKFKKITDNSNRNFFPIGYTFNPMHVEQSLKLMLEYQRLINISKGVFWLPMPKNDMPEHNTYYSVDVIFNYAISPALELYYILQWINNQLEPKQTKSINQNPIIEKEYLALIFSRFKEYFSAENMDSWIERFIYPTNEKISNIEVSEKAKEGSSKLVLLAILDAIQQKKDGNFKYQNFVFDRFGLKAFDRAKNEHREKKTYQETLKICSRILQNDTY